MIDLLGTLCVASTNEPGGLFKLIKLYVKINDHPYFSLKKSLELRI